jgi:hypothetical protein
MGPGLSLIPTLGLFAIYRATGDIHLRQAAEMFAVINAANLLPIYPLDGGLILNALIGSVSRKSALIAARIGILTGLGLATYLQSFLIGIPFLLFALLSLAAKPSNSNGCLSPAASPCHSLRSRPSSCMFLSSTPRDYSSRPASDEVPNPALSDVPVSFTANVISASAQVPIRFGSHGHQQKYRPEPLDGI